MHTSRRKFIQTGTLTIAGIALLPDSLFATGKAKTITGIQLYSVREETKNDPAGTLQTLAAMDYRYVENSSYIDRKFYE
ncbi:MAG: hypothetical protein JST09_16300 [Bacteroidetes bacterium]|nr:hypothetical protein [Bacteroidota bacterium]